MDNNAADVLSMMMQSSIPTASSTFMAMVVPQVIQLLDLYAETDRNEYIQNIKQ